MRTEHHGEGGSPVSPRTREFTSWWGMRQRCYGVNGPRYKDYGGRGIRVCPRWLNSYLAFLSDMGRCPDGHSLDRIDNNKDYTPENCRWATVNQQLSNRRIRSTCKNGHPLDMLGGNGFRRCRTCYLAYQRNYDKARR